MQPFEKTVTRRKMLAFAGTLTASVLGCEGGEAQNAEAPLDLASNLEPIRAKHDLPALASAVLFEGRLAGLGAVGERKYGSGIKVKTSDQFHLGSDTKAMTAALCGILVDQGKLKWETTLEEAFHELGSMMSPEYRKVTIDQLCSHRSGFSSESWIAGKSFLEMHQLPGNPREQRALYARAILQERPVSSPGTTTLYSNRNFAIAGIIAERRANLDWESLITKELFKPLGMKSTGFGAMGTPGKIDQPWQHKKAGGKREAIAPGPLSDNPPIIAPAGRVYMPLSEWAKFIQDQMNGLNGKKALLNQKTCLHLHTPNPGEDYVGGWIETTRPWGGGKVYTHTGSNTQNMAVVWMAPEKDFAVMIATNQAGSDEGIACDEVAGRMIQRFLVK